MHLHSPMADDPCRSCADGSNFVDWRQEIERLRAEMAALRAETATAAQNERARCLSACDIVYDKFEKEWELDRAVGAYACTEAIQALPATAAPSDPTGRPRLDPKWAGHYPEM